MLTYLLLKRKREERESDLSDEDSVKSLKSCPDEERQESNGRLPTSSNRQDSTTPVVQPMSDSILNEEEDSSLQDEELGLRSRRCKVPDSLTDDQEDALASRASPCSLTSLSETSRTRTRGRGSWRRRHGTSDYKVTINTQDTNAVRFALLLWGTYSILTNGVYSIVWKNTKIFFKHHLKHEVFEYQIIVPRNIMSWERVWPWEFSMGDSDPSSPPLKVKAMPCSGIV